MKHRRSLLTTLKQMLPSSNWLALKKNLPSGAVRDNLESAPKKRKIETFPDGTSVESDTVTHRIASVSVRMDRNHESVASLRQMVYGQNYYHPAHLLPGKYLAIDCEMVGIAGDPLKMGLGSRDKGDESSLARVSIVNYYGAVLLDVFVRQRERVTDWRTAVSGVRESDMLTARPFSEVQKLVANLLKDKFLIGHAVHNDLKALLLSHPHHMTRDTQVLAAKNGTLSTSKPIAGSLVPGTASVKVTVNRRPALRKLVSQGLGIDIQEGEHSSVIDARATMAIYRLHRKTWDKGFFGIVRSIDRKTSKTEFERIASGDKPQKNDISKRHKRSSGGRESAPGGPPAANASGERLVSAAGVPASVQRQGISSGLSVVVKRRRSGKEAKQVINGTRSGGSEKDVNWWGTLGR